MLQQQKPVVICLQFHQQLCQLGYRLEPHHKAALLSCMRFTARLAEIVGFFDCVFIDSQPYRAHLFASLCHRGNWSLFGSTCCCTFAGSVRGWGLVFLQPLVSKSSSLTELSKQSFRERKFSSRDVLLGFVHWQKTGGTGRLFSLSVTRPEHAKLGP